MSDIIKAINNRMNSNDAAHETSTYYDETYFNWQKEMGEFGGWADKMKFASHISPNDTVIDFGCGGGFLLKNISCSEKMGVEVNDTARSFAEKTNGIRAVKFVEHLEDSVADIIISNHALEHCVSPHLEIENLLKKLKPGGRIVLIVPCESNKLKWFPGDVNNHLFTWNPMTLGNLFTSAGYEVLGVHAVYHRWPPFYRQVAKLGWQIFNLSCKVYGTLRKSTSEVEIVARRPLGQPG
jgi:SAM-dependent methyltransferase